MSRGKKKKDVRKYEKPVSLYPLKPDDALGAFMKVKPEKVKKKKKDKK